MHTLNMAQKFKKYLSDTSAQGITSPDLLNWRAMLGEAHQHILGGLKSFLIAWYDYGFGGISKDVVDLLEKWRIKGNEKGAAVASGCPDTRLTPILKWRRCSIG